MRDRGNRGHRIRLAARLARLRRARLGFARSQGSGVHACATPVRGPGGTVILTLGVYAPSERFRGALALRIRRALRDGAEILGRTLTPTA